MTDEVKICLFFIAFGTVALAFAVVAGAVANWLCPM